MKTSRLRTKITITLLGVTVLTALFVCITSYIIFSRFMYEQAGSIGLESAKYNAEKIETWGREKIASLERTAAHIESLEDFEIYNIQKMLQDAIKADTSFYSVFIGLENGQLIDGHGWIPAEKYDATERPWYQIAQEANKATFTTVYIDKNKGEMVTSITVPIKLGEMKGVLAANIPIENILRQVNRIQYGKTGYGILLDKSANIIAHPNKEYAMQPFENVYQGRQEEWFEKIQSNVRGVENIFQNGEKQLLVYSIIPSSNWRLLLFAPMTEFKGPVNKMLVYLVIITLACLAGMMILGFFLSKSMSQPIEKIIEYVSKFAKGDLTEDVEIVSSDELGVLSGELNKMRKNLIHMIQEVQNESDLLQKNAKKLVNFVDEISNGVIEFIASLSHDIKTPLTLIKGYAKGVQVGIIKDPEKVQAYLEGIYYRAEEIENITSDILDCTYEIKKSLILKKEYIAIETIAENFFQLAKLQIESSDRIFIKKLKVRKVKLHIDQIKLMRVWNNLIDNAIKYSPKKSEITISIQQCNNRYIAFSIQDRGIGMKGDEIEKVFDMFYRVKDSSIKGYGIGLTICKTIVEAHEGHIVVESQYEFGSTFTFYIPFCH